ncbi:MAG TPA: FtsX-like permease family protein, partial [Planctomycetota bacterium]|nr:FtsX-like permease family protein [Planctomycetota bacterium]
MRAAVLARLCLRESRGSRGRLVVFGSCLAVGVAAVVAVAHLSEALRGGIRVHARELLAADVVVSSRSPLPAALDEQLAGVSVRARCSTVELDSVVSAPPRGEAPGPSRLAEIKAVDGPYPHYGRLELQPDRPLGELLGDDGAVVAPELLASLGLDLGDELRIGGVAFRVAGRVLAEPDRLDFSITSGPRVFISRAGLDRTPLLGFGTRARFSALLALPEGTPSAELDRLEAELERDRPEGASYRVETAADAQPRLRRGIDRTESFLGLLALLSLLIGGIGVAQTVRAWLAQRLTSIAILRCLGLRPGEVLRLYLLQTALLGLLGSAAGVAGGVAFAWAVPSLLDAEAYLPSMPAGLLGAWQPWAVLRGLALGTLVALLFALPELLTARAVPPLLVLRHDAELARRGRLGRACMLAVLAAGVFAAAWAQSGQLLFAALFAGGLALVAGALALAARGLVWLAARAPRRRLGLRLRHGLSALARPDAGTRSGTVALGVG